MTADTKKKAIDLVQKFRIFVGTSLDDDGDTINNYLIGKNVAKKCALICVDEILASGAEQFQADEIYWQQVKTAIIKL